MLSLFTNVFLRVQIYHSICDSFEMFSLWITFPSSTFLLSTLLSSLLSICHLFFFFFCLSLWQTRGFSNLTYQHNQAGVPVCLSFLSNLVQSSITIHNISIIFEYHSPFHISNICHIPFTLTIIIFILLYNAPNPSHINVSQHCDIVFQQWPVKS